MLKNGYQKYAKVKRENATPIGQMAILLDHGGDLMTKAHQALLDNRIEDRFIAIDKTMILLNGLMGILDPNPSPATLPLIQTMTQFYHKMLALLMQVNAKQDPHLCQEAIDRLKEMAQLWRDVDTDSTPTGPSPSPSPSMIHIG